MADHLGSSYAACLISVLMLALAGVTRFGAHLQGAWHVIYVVSVKRFRHAALADGELRLENSGQVLVSQQTVLNEDIAFKKTQ